jgi:hypothetical protein
VTGATGAMIPGSTGAGFVGAGFECSSHRRYDGRRLDLLAGTGHAEHAVADYAQVRELGFGWARDGVRWHLVERAPGRCCWQSWWRQLEAAERARVPVCWDILHFGYPDWLDIWSSDFPARAASFAAAAAQFQKRITGRSGLFCPINEISFMAYAGGERAWMAPHGIGEGVRLKDQLVRAAIAMARAIRSVDPGARLLWAEPLIVVAAADDVRQPEARAAEEAQYEAIDWIVGRVRPELGGSPDLADVLGFNHYPHNQRWVDGPVIGLGTPGFVGLADLMEGCAVRYPGARFILAETGAEGAGRSAWLRYVGEEIAIMLARGVPLDGVCLYPVTDYPGWDDGRHCHTGVMGMADACRPAACRRTGVFRHRVSAACRNVAGTSPPGPWLTMQEDEPCDINTTIRIIKTEVAVRGIPAVPDERQPALGDHRGCNRCRGGACDDGPKCQQDHGEAEIQRQGRCAGHDHDRSACGRHLSPLA